MAVYGLFLYDTFTPLCFLDHLRRYTANGTRSELNICAMFVLLYVLFQEIYIIIFMGVVWYDSQVGGPFKMFW